MPLTPGARLGPYEIIAAIGAGGMGEVYRATDTTLGRQVAIKILPEAFASDADRLARFEREAKTLASLNHQHIAAIYGVEKSSGTYALVMELVEGQDLAEMIGSRLTAQGLSQPKPSALSPKPASGLPITEALAIARQIAEALETAHEQGIVHRDLKPANVKVRPDGTVKVLDFGLAKAMDQVQGSEFRVQGSGSAALTNSPTLTSPALMTGAGMILGTAAYMSPEQAKGRVVDKRSDVWAFGCVLYEMLSGTRAFEGEDVADTLAFVLTREPDWNRLPADTPAGLRRLIRRCLEKDVRRRLRDIGEARIQIDNIAGGADDAAATTAASPAGTRGPSRAAQAAWAVGALLLGALGVAGGWLARAPVPAEPVAFTVTTGIGNRADAFSISPDGRYLAYGAYDPKDGQQRLWLRRIASTEARVLPGTEAATMPFWSPDSRAIAFFTGAELKRIDASGGAVQSIAKVPGPNGGGTWNEQNVIVFSRGNGLGLFKVSGSGGEPETITTLNKGESGHASPTFLPGGHHFLYVKVTESPDADVLVWRSLDSGDEHPVRKMNSKAFYLPAGYLVFRLNGPIVAQRFDPSAGTVSGDLVQVLPDTFQNGIQTALAASGGIIAHRAGDAATFAQLTWIDRNGKPLGTVGAAGDYRNMVVDAGGERALSNTADPSDIWLLDFRRGTTSRLTFGTSVNSDPVFSPDGRSFAFYSSHEPAGIYRKATSGTGVEELITPAGPGSYPRDWSSDARFLLYDTGPGGTIWVVPVDGSAKPSRYPPAASGTARVFSIARFSPDGKWVAYVSTEGGRPEIYVQDFPAAHSKFQVSTTGGSEPRWRSDGRELYYLGMDTTMMAVDVEMKPDLRLGVPKPLFPTKLSGFINASRRYGVSADGQRFLINVPIGSEGLPPITVVTNWTALLAHGK